jgi:hypothetical protein
MLTGLWPGVVGATDRRGRLHRAAAQGARALVVLAAAALVVPLFALQASAAAGDGYIGQYDVDITINDDGSLDVSEMIGYTFTDRSHGIYRIIPNRYPVSEPFTPESSETTIDTSYDRVVDIKDVRVISPSGAPTDLQISQEGSVLSIRVGDPDTTVKGTQFYLLRYRVEGALNSFDGYDELYWDAIGTEWSVPILRSTVRVEAPRIKDGRCFTGLYGGVQQCDETSVSATSFTAEEGGVGDGKGVSIVVTMPPGTVDVPPPVYEQRWSLQRAFALTPATVGAAAAVLLLGAAGIWWLVRRGRDRRFVGQIPGLAPLSDVASAEEMRPFGDSGEGPVEWAPPDDLRPGLLGTLIDEQANVLDVTATIVDLAVRGYLRIDEIPDKGLFSSRDWQLVQLKGGDTELLAYEQKLFAALFSGRNTVRLSKLKQTFAEDLKRVQSSMYDELVYRNWYRRRPDSTRTTWGVVGFAAVAVAVGATYLLASYTHFGVVGVALVIGAVGVWFASRDMPARTGHGSAVLARTLGFRRYLATAEAGQIRFEEGTDVFSRYLPYAIVFGEAERWAKVFATLAAAGGAAATMPAVAWYTSPHAFSFGEFGNSVNAFSVNASGSISAAAASSSGGGGGFSGGGFGGGGGGGW